MKLLKKLALAAVIFALPAQSMAWGTNGHRICGQIASSYLTPKAQAAIKAILGNESIAMASNWADFIKSDQSYSYLYNWHFINLDKAYSYQELQDYLLKDNDVDAYTKMNFMIGELKKKDISKENKLLYLRVLIHIVEDVHQPMHTGHKTDKGGNDVKVNWFSEPTNLHSIWDSKLIDFQQLSFTEYANAINFTTPAQRKQWQQAPICMWIFESNQIADKLYSEVKPDERLDFKYNFKHYDLLNQQLLKGGVRLAGILNSIFG